MIKVTMNINSFWISTSPRTGSMWLYNVTREILKVTKMNVLPIKIPKSDQKFFEILEKQSLISNRNSGDWKKSFSPKEIKILDLEFKDFISEYKF